MCTSRGVYSIHRHALAVVVLITIINVAYSQGNHKKGLSTKDSAPQPQRDSAASAQKHRIPDEPSIAKATGLAREMYKEY